MNSLAMKPRPLFLQKQNNRPLLLLLLILWSLLPPSLLRAQHLIGVRGGYNISGIDFQRNDTPKTVNTATNFSILYTYYHPMWEMFPYFGLQTGINFSEQGFLTPGDHPELYDAYRYKVFTIPLTSQFHVDFWKMRLLVNIGAYGGYRLSAKEVLYTTTGEEIKRDYVFDCYDTRLDYGFTGGGGLSYRIDPFEIQFECNYSYSLSTLYSPKKLSNSYYIYVYPHQLIFSLGLFFRLSK